MVSNSNVQMSGLMVLKMADQSLSLLSKCISVQIEEKHEDFMTCSCGTVMEDQC